MGSQIVRILAAKKNSGKWDLKIERVAVKKVVTERTVVLLILIFTSHITFRFEITIKRLYVRFMLKQKVTIKVGVAEIAFTQK